MLSDHEGTWEYLSLCEFLRWSSELPRASRNVLKARLRSFHIIDVHSWTVTLML